jgi:predicted acetyltransferase
MMRRLIDDERAAGKMLASLRASEAMIYPRFGFGLAGEAVGVRVHPHRIDTVRGAHGGSMRILTPAQFDAVIPELYTRAATRAGAISRSPFFWTRILKEASEGGKPTFVAVHTSPEGTDDGYVLYSVEWGEESFAENFGHGHIHDLFGATPGAELALWQYMVNISLLRSIDVGGRPVDDLIRLAIPDSRAYQVRQRWDEQWIRLLDVEAALADRSYHDGQSVTIAVDDPWYAENCGTFRVSGEGVSRTTDTAELTAPIEAIGAAYMGAMPWRDLLAVGRVSGDPDAAARADTLFTHRPTTWSATFF